MAHEIESMFSYKKTPWHGLGTILDNPPTSAEAIAAAGLDWKVSLREMVSVGRDMDGSIYPIEVPGHFGVVRERDNHKDDLLGVVQSRYSVLQNSKAFDFMDSVLGDKVIFESAGSLKGGKVIWILARFQDQIEVVASDYIRKYLLLSHSHDGSTPIRIAVTPVRVICWNTLSMAGGDTVFSFRHTINATHKMKFAESALRDSESRYERLAHIYRDMDRVRLSIEKAKTLLDKVLIADSKEESTRITNRKNQILDMWKNGAVGSELVGNTSLWSFYNAFTEYFDHHSNLTKSQDSRVYSNWVGSSANTKGKLFNLAVELLKEGNFNLPMVSSR